MLMGLGCVAEGLTAFSALACSARRLALRLARSRFQRILLRWRAALVRSSLVVFAHNFFPLRRPLRGVKSHFVTLIRGIARTCELLRVCRCFWSFTIWASSSIKTIFIPMAPSASPQDFGPSDFMPDSHLVA